MFEPLGEVEPNLGSLSAFMLREGSSGSLILTPVWTLHNFQGLTWFFAQTPLRAEGDFQVWIYLVYLVLSSCVLQEKSYACTVLFPYLYVSSWAWNSWTFLAWPAVSYKLFHISVSWNLFNTLSSLFFIPHPLEFHTSKSSSLSTLSFPFKALYIVIWSPFSFLCCNVESFINFLLL